MMKSGSQVLAAILAALSVAPACLAQTNTNEVEPNDTKAAATVVAAMSPGDPNAIPPITGDTLTGTSTGSLTTGLVPSVDPWDIPPPAAPAPGIYKYPLSIDDASHYASGVGHTMTIRGLTQAGG